MEPFMKVIYTSFLFLLAIAINNIALAGDSEEIEKVRAELSKMMPMAKDMKINKTDAKGVYEGELNNNFIYIHVSGDHVLIGDLLNTKTKQNLGELASARRMTEEVASASTDEMIVFAGDSKGADSGRFITVFTDIDCGYCRKLHAEVPEASQ